MGLRESLGCRPPGRSINHGEQPGRRRRGRLRSDGFPLIKSALPSPGAPPLSNGGARFLPPPPIVTQPPPTASPTESPVSQKREAAALLLSPALSRFPPRGFSSLFT